MAGLFTVSHDGFLGVDFGPNGPVNCDFSAPVSSFFHCRIVSVGG